MRSAILVLIFVSVCILAGPALLFAQSERPAAESLDDMLSRGDTLRHAGDYTGALSVYRDALTAQGDSAAAWKRVAWAEKALRHFSAARQAFEKAISLDPNDQEARDDLASLKLSRGLTARAWLGGTEPGTSRTAADGELWYGGIDNLELYGGGGWTDNIFYSSWKGSASAYWYFLPESYAKVKLGLYGYTYTAPGSTPDSSAYKLDPRAQLEVSHWISPWLRAGLGYQLDVPDFQYDPSTWFTTHKLTGELESRFGGLHFWGTGGMLYDPDPNSTVVAGSPSNLSGAPTSIVYRFNALVGAGLSYDAGMWSLGARFLTNRDLDASYDWSIISRFTLQPIDPLSFDVEWIFDAYSKYSGTLVGNYGSILWGTVGYEVLRGVVLSAGVKWVYNTLPVSDPVHRNDLVLLLNLQYRTGLY